MINKLSVYVSNNVSPYHNLAVEQYLLEHVQEGQCILYLWQNQNTVVIGRNQNAFRECRVELLQQEGGHLARRLSGGGAVFHDLGNLNFTFLVPTKDYDLHRQQSVIAKACMSFGIPVTISGRNDILADGRKFSGNAFYHAGGRSYHHGTLMIGVDGERMKRYLSPSKEKLAAKSVESVRSRVVNLRELDPGLTCEDMKAALSEAFGSVYGAEPEQLPEDYPDAGVVSALTKLNRSYEWLFGNRIPFTCSFYRHFDWGEATLELVVQNGIVSEAKVYTDAMDWSIPARAEQAVTGQRFVVPELQRALRGAGLEPGITDDLCGMLEEV